VESNAVLSEFTFKFDCMQDTPRESIQLPEDDDIESSTSSEPHHPLKLWSICIISRFCRIFENACNLPSKHLAPFPALSHLLVE
jgi:hypothetical protein